MPYLHDMIGPETHGTGVGPDPNVAGWGGASIDATGDPANNLADRAGSIFNVAYQPDVIILYIGWNEMWGGSPSTAPARIEAYYNSMRTARPNAKIALCTLSQSSDGWVSDDITAFNARVRTIAANNATTTALCDLWTLVFAPTDLAGWLHWTEAGAAKAAQAIYDVLLSRGWLAASPTVTKIEAIGDSFTAGAGDGTFYSYRGALQALMTAGGGTPPPSGTWEWDGKKVSDAQLTAAHAAAVAAAEGNKDVAYLTSLQTAIGTGYRRKIWRNGATVYEATVTGTLPIVGKAFVLPATKTKVSIAAADINTATWIHRIEPLTQTNPEKFIATRLTKTGGAGPALLTGNLLAGGDVTMGSYRLNAPAYDSVTAPPPTPTAIIDTMVNHMKTGPHVLPGAPAADWARGGCVVRGADMRAEAVPSWWGGNDLRAQYPYWGYLLTWYVLWDLSGHQANLNTVFCIDRLETWLLHDTGTWAMLAASAPGSADQFNRTFTGVGEGPSLYSIRFADGSLGHRIQPNQDAIWHGYGAAGNIPSPSTLRGIHVRMRGYKRLADPGGTDDRHLARYAGQAGVDAYPSADTTMSQFGVGYNSGVGPSQFVEVGNTPMWIYFSTLAKPPSYSVDTSFAYNHRQTMSESFFRGNPPPVPT